MNQPATVAVMMMKQQLTSGSNRVRIFFYSEKTFFSLKTFANIFLLLLQCNTK
jgi:hypothetical protein